MTSWEDEYRAKRQMKRASAVFLLYGFLAFLYISIGVVVLIFQRYWKDFPSEMKLAFGILCIAYGCFRLYRAYDSYREKLAEVE